jgi:tetratricopeptide (TPR) repeat protein
MFLKSALTIGFILLLGYRTSAQVDTGHHVYGLVVGISDYANKAFKDLKYADDDAILFADFLKKKMVQPQDTGNITLLTNKRASAIPVWNEINKMQNKAKEGDTVYFYFSGHGSASNPEDIFIICHDAVKGQLDAGGCVNINSLKNRIKIMTANKVKVILITDACRTNESNDNVNNLMFTEALTKRAGDIQFSSCSKNEKSMEDRRWGDGHGVFTWYLWKGWMGMADDNNNKRVTFDELSKYVTYNVRKATYDSIADKAMQTPYSCCVEYSDILMANVNPDHKKKMIEMELQGNSTLYAMLIPQVFTRGSDNEVIEDSLALEYYSRLNDAIDREVFLDPDSSCAIFYYKQFEQRQKTGPTLEESRMDLVAAMANKAQSYIQRFLQGEADSITNSDYWYASRLMYKSLELMDTSNDFYTSMKARALFLEANSMMYYQDEMRLAFYKLDTSLQLEPGKAYIYYNKARIYEKFNVFFDSAQANYLRAIKLAPQWVNPLIDLGNMYIDKGDYDKGTLYFNKAITMQPGPYVYNLLGYTYYTLSEKEEHQDSALMYYHKALQLDPENIDAELGIAAIYRKKKMYDTANIYYMKALAADSTYYYTYAHLGAFEYYRNNMQLAEYYYRMAIYYHPRYTQAHIMLGYIYNHYLNEKDKAIDAYYECVKIDYYHTQAYTAIGNILAERKQYDEAIRFLKYPLTYDPSYNPVYLADAYIGRAVYYGSPADYDTAKSWLDSSVLHFPDAYYNYAIYGSYYYDMKEIEKSKASFRKSSSMNSTYYYNWVMLGFLHFMDKNYDSAIYYYNRGIEEAPGSEHNYEYLWKVYHYGTLDYSKAVLAADMAIERKLNVHRFYYLKSLSLMQAKNYTAALEAIDSATMLYGYAGRYLFTRAQVLSGMGRTDDALEWLRESIKAGLSATRDEFYDGSFRNIEENKKFKKIVKKYLRKNN